MSASIALTVFRFRQPNIFDPRQDVCCVTDRKEKVKMTKLAIAIPLVVILAVPTLAAAQTIRARLTGSEEVPVVSTEARGDFRGRINRAAQTIDFELTYSGLQGTVTQAHIHVGQPNVNGVIVIWLCDSDSSPSPIATTPPCGSPDFSVTGTIAATDVVVSTAGGAAPFPQQITDGELDEVIAAIRAGNAYVNVHTNLSPGGEIRGQIRTARQ
jgi:hypothetical protein